MFYLKALSYFRFYERESNNKVSVYELLSQEVKKSSLLLFWSLCCLLLTSRQEKSGWERFTVLLMGIQLWVCYNPLVPWLQPHCSTGQEKASNNTFAFKSQSHFLLVTSLWEDTEPSWTLISWFYGVKSMLLANDS